MKVLLSIKPQYVEQIFNGSKKFEYRKSIFKNKDITTIVVYATMPVGKIVGEFEIKNILQEHPAEIWKKTKKYAGVTEEFYDKYFSGRDKAYAIEIKSLNKYKIAICPYINKKFVAPQSLKYIEDSKIFA